MTQIHSEPDLLVDVLVNQIIQNAHTQALLVDVLLQYTNGRDAQIVDAVRRQLQARQLFGMTATAQLPQEAFLLPTQPLADAALSAVDVHFDGQPLPLEPAKLSLPMSDNESAWSDSAPDDSAHDELNETEVIEPVTTIDVSFDDPVRMYLQEIGKVKLLRAADEVVLAWGNVPKKSVPNGWSANYRQIVPTNWRCLQSKQWHGRRICVNMSSRTCIVINLKSIGQSSKIVWE